MHGYHLFFMESMMSFLLACSNLASGSALEYKKVWSVSQSVINAYGVVPALWLMDPGGLAQSYVLMFLN